MTDRARGVALLINKFPHYSGGVEHVIDRYSDALHGLGLETAVVTQAPDPTGPAPARYVREASVVATVPRLDAETTGSAVEAARFVARSTWGFEARATVRRLTDQHNVRIAMVFNAYHHLAFSYLPVLRRRGIPALLSIHDYKPGCTNYRCFDERTSTICTDCLQSTASYLHRPIARGCVRGSRMASTALVAESVSQRLQRTYRSGFAAAVVLNRLQQRILLDRGMSAARIHLVPNAVDPPVQTWNGDVHAPVLYVGRLTVEKGVSTLLRAAAAARRRLVILGDGPQRNELEAEASRLPLDAQFLGWRSHDAVLDLMASASQLVVPSEWPEVFPLVACEAMAMGLPVTATAVGGHIDLLSDDRGRLVQPGSVAELAHALNPEHSDLMTRSTLARSYAHTELAASRWRMTISGIVGRLLAGEG